MPAGGGSLNVLDLIRHRGGLGLPHRRGQDGGRHRLDDAAGRQRPHVQQHGRQLPGGLVRAAPAPRPLPDAQRGEPPTCTPSGTTGAWNAASGNSQRLAGVVDEPRRRGPARPWRSRSPTSATGARRTSACSSTTSTLPDGTTTSFEGDLGGWTVSGPPEGSGENANDWIRHGRRRVPGRRVDHDAQVDPDGLRVRGDLDPGGAQGGDGPRRGTPPRRRLIHASGGRLWAAPATWVLQALVMYGGRPAPSRHGWVGEGFACWARARRGGPFGVRYADTKGPSVSRPRRPPPARAPPFQTRRAPAELPSACPS